MVLVPVIFSVCPHAHQAAEKVFETSILAAHGAAPQLGINKMHVNVARGHAPRWSFLRSLSRMAVQRAACGQTGKK